MCGRFTLSALAGDLAGAVAVLELFPRYNIAPSQTVRL
jgi:hypothetical protein